MPGQSGEILTNCYATPSLNRENVMPNGGDHIEIVRALDNQLPVGRAWNPVVGEQLRGALQLQTRLSPAERSAIEQQTVSILRALVTDPEVLFLDEPFSALDYEMTLFMREQLQTIFMKTRTTMILVSHDLDEAIQHADKVVLLTRRPTKIAEIIDVDLPWPRNLDVTTGQRFTMLKRHCLQLFWREVER